MKKMFIIFAPALLALCALAACDSTYVGLEGKTVEFKVTGITPASGPSGTVVEITGTGFSRDASQMTVLFGNKPSKVLTSSAESISAVAPSARFTYSRVDPYPEYPKTSEGDIFEESCDEVMDVVWDTTYTITSGLQFTELTLVTSDQELQQIHLLKVEPKSPAGSSSSGSSSSTESSPLSPVQSFSSSTLAPPFLFIS